MFYFSTICYVQTSVMNLYSPTVGKFLFIVYPWITCHDSWKQLVSSKVLQKWRPGYEGSGQKESVLKKRTQNHINKEHNPLETVTFFNILLTVAG